MAGVGEITVKLEKETVEIIRELGRKIDLMNNKMSSLYDALSRGADETIEAKDMSEYAPSSPYFREVGSVDRSDNVDEPDTLPVNSEPCGECGYYRSLSLFSLGFDSWGICSLRGRPELRKKTDTDSCCKHFGVS